MGKMAFKMLERNTSVFYEDDVKKYGLKVTEVTVLSGMCTELSTAASDSRRTYCFIHFTFQVKLFQYSRVFPGFFGDKGGKGWRTCMVPHTQFVHAPLECCVLK